MYEDDIEDCIAEEHKGRKMRETIIDMGNLVPAGRPLNSDDINKFVGVRQAADKAYQESQEGNKEENLKESVKGKDK